MSVLRRLLLRRLCLLRLGLSGGSFVLSWLGVLVDLVGSGGAGWMAGMARWMCIHLGVLFCSCCFVCEGTPVVRGGKRERVGG